MGVLPDLYFCRDPKGAEKEGQAATEKVRTRETPQGGGTEVAGARCLPCSFARSPECSTPTDDRPPPPLHGPPGG